MSELLEKARRLFLSECPDKTVEKILSRMKAEDIIAAAYSLFPEKMPGPIPPEIMKKIKELKRGTRSYVEGDKIVIELDTNEEEVSK